MLRGSSESAPDCSVNRRFALAQTVDEVGAAAHPVGVLSKVAQQAKLVGTQGNPHPIPPRHKGDQVDHQRPCIYRAGRLPFHALRLQRQHPVEHRGPVERADHVVIRPRLERAAAILGVVLVEHHGHMCIGGARIGAQAATHLESGKVVHHPIDKHPQRPLHEAPRAIGPQPVERETAAIMDEILKGFAQRTGQEDGNDVHDRPVSQVPVEDAEVTRRCDAFVTGF